MTVNVDEAFGLETFGLALKDENGNVTGYFTTHAGDPTGSPAPKNTWCFDETNQLLYYKYNTGNNDWRQISAEDITFDPTNLLNFDPTDTDIYKALARLGNQTIADVAEIEGFNSNAQETTTSNGWVSKTGFPWTSSPKTAGLFSVRWFYEVGQTKATRNFGHQVLWSADGITYTPLSDIPSAAISKDDNTFMQSGFKEVILPANGPIYIDIQYGQTIDGFAAIMENVTVEVRRIGDYP